MVLGVWLILRSQRIKYLTAQKKLTLSAVLFAAVVPGDILCCRSYIYRYIQSGNLYGIGNLETLVSDTHKFESRYLDKLVGLYPEQKTIYQKRSPINHIDQLNCPVIFLQGLEDKVVPANQAELMVDSLKKQGVDVVYVEFADEGHGFRKSENIIKAMESELAFYTDVFDLVKED